jgi:hypothetical protein
VKSVNRHNLQSENKGRKGKDPVLLVSERAIMAESWRQIGVYKGSYSRGQWRSSSFA